MLRICIRREEKNAWERRAPLTPQAVKRLVDMGIPIWVEACNVRIFPDQAYAEAGATVVEDGSDAELILGIKEPKMKAIKDAQVHVAFSHTIKAQAYNMDLLQEFLDRQCTLIDYETMRNDQGERVIAFGRYAGVAGAVDTFHLVGQKLAMAGKESSLSKVEMTHTYGDLSQLKQRLSELKPLTGEPVQVLVVGSGKVGKGAIEVCQWLGLPEISHELVKSGEAPAGNWYAVVRTQDIFARKDGGAYDRESFRTHGSEQYESAFHHYLGHFNVLLQTNYWEVHYPKQFPQSMFVQYKDKLPLVIGDISCDIEGSIACTVEATTIDMPGKTYLPENHELVEGVSWDGPVLMSIDHLPCELSLDASNDFSKILESLIPFIAGMDRSKSLQASGMSKLLQDATIVYNGTLTENYNYLEEALKN